MIFKRIISAVTGLAMAFSMIGFVPVIADENEVYTGNSAEIANDDVRITGTNSFGTMLADALNTEQGEKLENMGYNIFSIEMDGNTASVSFETLEDCTLVVAVYDEDSEAMLASGSIEVTSDQKEVSIEIVGDIPDYFYLRGFLVDEEVFRPLCTVYESEMYTKEMQEFLAKTTADFDSERVLNFDDDNTTNFAVYGEDVILLDETAGELTADEYTNTYTFTNANDQVKDLKEGDVFAYGDVENVSIVTVATVSVDGDIVTITDDAKAELEDIFEYVRIENNDNLGAITVDESYCDEGVTYEGVPYSDTDSTTQYNTKYYGSPYTYNVRMPDIEFVDVDKSKEFNFKFNIIEKETKDDNITNKLNLNVNLKLEFNIKVYISTTKQHFELNIDYELKGEGSVQTTLTLKKQLALFGFILPPGVIIEVAPSFIAEFSMKMSLSAKINGSIIFKAVHNKKGIEVDLSISKPEVTSDLKGEATLFMGFSLEPKIKVIDDSIAKTGLEAKVGAEIKMTKTSLTTNKSAFHSCKNCFDGDINFKASAEFSISFLKLKSLTYKRILAEKKDKIADFYWSQDHNEFGFGNCPYNTYKATITVYDKEKNEIENADVNIGNIKRKTDKEGKVVEYLPTGKHNVTVSAGEKGTANGSITVKDDAVKKTFYVSVNNSKDDDDSDQNLGETGNIQVVSIVALGTEHSACITENGDLYTWGDNYYFQLGDNAENRYTPTKIMSNVKAVDFGSRHSACITENGDLSTWGWNFYGQLGNGIEEFRYTPTKIMNNVKAVSLGYGHSACITENDDLYAWGYNWLGQLGDGTKEDKNTPTKIMSNVKSVSLGWVHSACITENGDLYTWGSNEAGQLGDGTKEDKSAPTKIMSNVKSVSLGSKHSACITENGDLYTWGDNTYCQLGDGTQGSLFVEGKSTPNKIMSNVKSVSLGDDHSACITENGDLYIWGENGYGQLGDGTKEDKSTPTKIMSNVKAVDFGSRHSACITENGDLYTWGYNDDGQLGDGTNENKSTPTKIMIPNETVTISLASTNIAAPASANPFSGLISSMVYNVYAMQSRNVVEPFSADNLLYIGQAVSDENGTISGGFIPVAETEDMEWFAVPMTQTDISGAEVTLNDLEYNGEEQFVEPVVKLDGETLLGGRDYYLEGDYSAVDPGTYTVTIKGTGLYTGEIEVEYKILNGIIGDVNGDGKIDSADVIKVAAYVKGTGKLTDAEVSRTNVNGDGKIDSADVVKLAAYVKGIGSIS